MNLESFFWLLIALIILTLFAVWIRSFFKRSLTPDQGESYVITFLGIHILEVRIGDPSAKWYQKLPFYPLGWPLNKASFIYEWAQIMTYQEYLEKVEISKKIKDYSVTILWQPRYRPEDLGEDRLPKDKTVSILVGRKERMYSLRSLEGYTLAVQFETENGFRGYRLFTLFLEIENLSKVISKSRHWQNASSLPFKSEYNAWSKKVTYEKLRNTTIRELDVELGKSNTDSFVDEINENIKNLFGYFIKSVNGGDFYLNPESEDLLESQEKKKKSQDSQDAAKIEAETLKIQAQAKADSIKIEAGGESDAIRKKGQAENEIIEERTKIAVKAVEELGEVAVKINQSKFGTEGLGKLPGVYIEGGSEQTAVNPQKIVEGILAIKISQNQKT
ncbi:MAG: hypothetical protein QG674_342 [Patescibacteria group bacterium]|nr:hypothetical protein [Patescibacteria group bacterium]